MATINDGDQFTREGKYGNAINAYNDVISDYADTVKYPKITKSDFCKIAEIIQKRANAYYQKALISNDQMRKLFAKEALKSYEMALSLCEENSCGTNLYQICNNGIHQAKTVYIKGNQP